MTVLCNYLPYLKNNNKQNDYYLTYIIEIILMHEQKMENKVLGCWGNLKMSWIYINRVENNK